MVLMVAGLHVPGMPLFEVAGSAGGALFWQSGPMAVNVGVTCGSIVMLKVAGQCAITTTLTVVVNPQITPSFTALESNEVVP